MIKDLHSAILLCALLSSPVSTTSLQAQSCVNPRPLLSTLFGNRNVKHKLRLKLLFKSNAFEMVGNRASRPRFFDPSFVPLDFRIKNTFYSLKRVANSSRGSPVFLNPQAAQTYPIRDRRLKHQNGVINKRRDTFAKTISTGRPDMTSRYPSLAHESQSATETLESDTYSPPNSLGRKQSRPCLDLKLDRLHPVVYGELGDIEYRRRQIKKGLRLHTTKRFTPPSRVYLRLCQTLILTAFHQSLRDGTVPTIQFTSHTPVKSTSWSFPWLVKQANLVWRRIGPSTSKAPLMYATTKIQLLALSNDMDNAEKMMDDLMATRYTFGGVLPWQVLQCFRTIFWVSLHREGQEIAFLRLVRRWELIRDILRGSPSFRTTHETRVYIGLLKKMVFGALDQIKTVSVWYDQVSSKQPAGALQWSQQTHADLGLLLLSYVILRLKRTAYDDPIPEATTDLNKVLLGLIIAMQSKGYSLPKRMSLQCSVLLAKQGQLDPAEELSRMDPTTERMPTPSVRDPNQKSPDKAIIPREEHNVASDQTLFRPSAFQKSIALEIAAQKGDVLMAIDKITELFQMNMVRKRDIRHLLQAYALAPNLELDSTSRRIGIDNGTGDPNEVIEAGSRLEDAEQIFNKFFAPFQTSAEDYGAIISAYARQGNVEKVKIWIKRMVNDGIPVESIPWEQLLKVFATNGNILAVASLIDTLGQTQQMQQVQSQQSPTSSTKGNGKQAQLLQNATIFNILLDLFIRRRDPHNAEQLWRNFAQDNSPEANYRNVVKLMRAHAEAGNWSGVIRVWDYLHTSEGVQSDRGRRSPVNQYHDIEVYNIILRAYVAMGTPFMTVLRLYDQLRTASNSKRRVNPDSFTFTMLIISATDAGEMDQASLFFRVMEATEQARLKAVKQNRGRRPSRSLPKLPKYRPIYALTYIMAGYLRQKKFKKATEVYGEIQKQGLALLPLTCAILLKAYTSKEIQQTVEGSLDLAEDFLSRVVDADEGLESFQSPISAPANEMDETNQAQQEQARPTDLPNSANYVWVAGLSRPRARESVGAPLLSEYIRRQDVSQVKRILDQVVQVGGEPSISSLTMLMDVQRKIGDHLALQQTWDNIWEVAQAVLEEEIALRKLVKKAREVQDVHEEVVKVRHNKQAMLCYPFSIYMDSMSRAGYHASVAIEWQRLREAGFAFDAHNWNHLVIALVRAGEVERAVEVVEKVILAYAEASQQIVLDRDRVHHSPITDETGDGNDDPIDITSDVIDGAYRWSRRRGIMKTISSSSSRLSQLEQLSQGSDVPFDFVHDLHVLQKLNRTWNIWRPHRHVLKVLYKALTHMERGMPVLAHYPSESTRTNEAGEAVPTSGEVYETLRRIWERYPRTVELVYRQNKM